MVTEAPGGRPGVPPSYRRVSLTALWRRTACDAGPPVTQNSGLWCAAELFVVAGPVSVSQTQVMDDVFSDIAMAIILGDIEGLEATLAEDPGWATKTSSVSHPTLLQFVACDAASLPDPVGAAKVLVKAGSDVGPPLVAAAGCGSTEVLLCLLEHSAGPDGDQLWTPLDEAIYWDNTEIVELLLERGARVDTLRSAAGLGRVDEVAAFFDGAQLRAGAGPIGSPFPDTVPAARANDPGDIIDNAFVTAVNCGQREAAEGLLGRGARVNSSPPGFHWQGTALHAACWRGQPAMVEWLLAVGADAALRDGMVDSDAVGWARHHDHPHVVDVLEHHAGQAPNGSGVDPAR